MPGPLQRLLDGKQTKAVILQQPRTIALTIKKGTLDNCGRTPPLKGQKPYKGQKANGGLIETFLLLFTDSTVSAKRFPNKIFLGITFLL